MSESSSERDWQAVYLPFVEAVRNFVNLVEFETEQPAPLYLAELNTALLQVAVTGFELGYPDTDEDEEFDIGAMNPGLEAESAIRMRIERLLEPISVHAKTKEAYEPHAYFIRTFENDIAEAYRDLAHGLRAWDLGHTAARLEATWQWRFGKSHWHTHLYRALLGVCLVRFYDCADGVEQDYRAETELRTLLKKEGYIAPD
jgi:hypothetical protein